MTLSNKINLIIISTLVVVLTAAFWLITNIESQTLRTQTSKDSETTVNLMNEDIARMFIQISNQKKSLQEVVDKMSSISGVEYIQISSTDGYFVAATQHDLIDTKLDEADMEIVNKVVQKQSYLEVRKDENGGMALERHIPIKLSTDEDSRIINVIETEVLTKTKSPQDIREAELLLQMISDGIEQSARAVILTREYNLKSLQAIIDNMMKFGFFHDVFVFDNNLNIIAATSGQKDEPAKDPQEYKDLKKDIIAGKKAFASYSWIHSGENATVNLTPVYLNQVDHSNIVGLVEAHLLTDAFQSRIDALRIRMAGVALVVMILLSIILTLFLRKAVLSPIREYSQIAQKVAAGDLNQRIEKTSSDEIGKFGEVFNLMVSNLRELDRLKSEFISVAAHQLRTPLSAIKWAVKMVIDGDAGPLNEEQKNILDQGYKSNERMILLINDLLDVSRIEAGKFEYEFIDGSVEELVDTTINEFQQIAKHKSVELKYHKADRALPKVKMDPLKLKMVIENLIDNAIKYTAPGGQVEVLFKYYRNIIEFVVSDNGVGIPKDQVAQLFSKFFRAKNVIKMQTDGTGLGLFIAKKIIEKHGGVIWAESEEGKGTQMHFTLPTL